jgi:hypothetical protein
MVIKVEGDVSLGGGITTTQRTATQRLLSAYSLTCLLVTSFTDQAPYLPITLPFTDHAYADKRPRLLEQWWTPLYRCDWRWQ